MVCRQSAKVLRLRLSDDKGAVIA